MAQVLDQFAILQTLYRFIQAQDRLDLATMASLLVPDRNIEFDLTKHMPDAGMLDGNAAEISNIFYEASERTTADESSTLSRQSPTFAFRSCRQGGATQHPMYNPVIALNGTSKTTVQAMVQAYHCLEIDGRVDSLTVRAVWNVKTEKLDSAWLMADMSMERDIPTSNPMLFMQAKEQAGTGRQRQPLAQPSAWPILSKEINSD